MRLFAQIHCVHPIGKRQPLHSSRFGTRSDYPYWRFPPGYGPSCASVKSRYQNRIARRDF